MKKLFLMTVAITLFFALLSIAYSADEVLTSEKLCGIWEGYFNYQPRFGVPRTSSSRLLITPNLSGIFFYRSQYDSYVKFLDGQGEIVNNELVMREKVLIRIKLKMDAKNILEGEGTTDDLNKGNLTKLKKVRDLTDAEKQKTLEELAGLMK